MPAPQGARAAIVVIDLGLTAVKAALVEPSGAFAALARRFWAQGERTFDLERDLANVWPMVVDTVRAALQELPGPVQVQAVALSAAAQMGICLDERGEAFALPRPDDPRQRGAASLHLGANGYGRTLLRTIRAARRSRPDAYRRIDRVGALHTYVLWRLTGRWCSDPATGPGALVWSQTLERSTGLARSAFPELLPQEAVAGPLCAATAQALGLPSGVPVVVGGHDGACASFGAGAYRPGDALVNLSTNFVPRVVTGWVVRGLFGYPIRPGAWAWVDGLPYAGRQLDIAARVIARGDPAVERDLGRRALECLDEPCVASTLAYLPPAALEDHARRVEAALAVGAAPPAVYLAVVQGCVAALAARVREGARWGIRPRRFVATGGFSRQAVVIEALRRALGAPVELAHPESGALGAAALAAPTAGWFESPEEALGTWRNTQGTPV